MGFSMFKIIIFLMIIALVLFLGDMLYRVKQKKEILDTIMVYKHNTKYSDKTSTQIIKKINANSKPLLKTAFYKHDCG